MKINLSKNTINKITQNHQNTMRNLKILGLLFSVCITFCFLSCNTSTPSNIPTLNVENALNKNSGSEWQEKIEVVSVIPLETSETVLLADIQKVLHSNNLFFILDTETKLRQFDMKGKFIREIGQEGQGPGEYSMLTDFAIDKERKEVYINDILKIVVYDYEGNFKRNISLEDDNLQVFTLSNDKLFYIFPDKKHPDVVKSATLVTVLDLDGKLQSEFPAHQLRRTGDIPFFNNIATDGKSVFYKEEMGQTLYAIKDDLSVDSICFLDFGEYAFKPEDFEFSKNEIWKERYRLQNILPSKFFMIFILQKGLIGQEFEPFIWNRNDNTFCRFEYKVSHKGEDLLVLPYAVSGNKVIGVLAASEKEIESDNPLLVVLEIKE